VFETEEELRVDAGALTSLVAIDRDDRPPLPAAGRLLRAAGGAGNAA
jgi:hypothetical protein